MSFPCKIVMGTNLGLPYGRFLQQQQLNSNSLVTLQVNDFKKNHRFELRDKDLKKQEIIAVI